MAQHPLTDVDFDEIKLQLQNLTDVDAEIKRAESAGLDMAAQKKEATLARNQLTKLRQAYFPNRV